MDKLALWLLAVIAAERSAELISTATVFEPLRKFIKDRTYPLDRPPPDTHWQDCKVWLDKLINCGYCTSVWTGSFFAFFVPPLPLHPLASLFLAGLAIHGLACLFHSCLEVLRYGYPIAIPMANHIAIFKKGGVTLVDILPPAEDKHVGIIGTSGIAGSSEIEQADPGAGSDPESGRYQAGGGGFEPYSLPDGTQSSPEHPDAGR